jgi:DNA-directed RNA polymerase subunit K/omega
MKILVKESPLSIPLDALIDDESNVYETTCVAISLANRLAANGDQEIENNNEKVVSQVLKRVLEEEIEYTVGDDE